MTNIAYKLAQDDIGTWEWADGHNPKVVQYFHDVGHEWVKDDETAWCAAFVGAMLKRANMPHTGKLNARSYLDIGEEVPLSEAVPGDIVIFSRGDPDGWQGHVGFFVRRAGAHIEVLGGNQANQVNIKRYPASRLLGVRRLHAKPVAVSKNRAKPTQSKTVQASAVTMASGAGAAVSAISGLDQYAQYIVLGFAGLAVLAGLFIMRERLKAWSDGWR